MIADHEFGKLSGGNFTPDVAFILADTVKSLVKLRAGESELTCPLSPSSLKALFCEKTIAVHTRQISKIKKLKRFIIKIFNPLL